MSPKPVFRRRSALRDTEQAVIYYAREAGLDTAARFVESLEATYCAIGEGPGLGSPRHGQELHVSGLRTRPIRRFPYLIFYLEHESYVEIWRILDVRSDVAGVWSTEG